MKSILPNCADHQEPPPPPQSSALEFRTPECPQPKSLAGRTDGHGGAGGGESRENVSKLLSFRQQKMGSIISLGFSATAEI
ncbi:hypothetical protein V9T40_011873 [Parthenolecanium corni]|uniref:Uncharacterized protein n=1 Tax=Parthenolecanium corni TaxID=536013 RepID=A0AAN9T646_9HEMI